MDTGVSKYRDFVENDYGFVAKDAGFETKNILHVSVNLCRIRYQYNIILLFRGEIRSFMNTNVEA